MHAVDKKMIKRCEDGVNIEWPNFFMFNRYNTKISISHGSGYENNVFNEGPRQVVVQFVTNKMSKRLEDGAEIEWRTFVKMKFRKSKSEHFA